MIKIKQSNFNIFFIKKKKEQKKLLSIVIKYKKCFPSGIGQQKISLIKLTK